MRYRRRIHHKQTEAPFMVDGMGGSMIYWVAYRKYIPWHRGSHTGTDTPHITHIKPLTMHKRLAHRIFSFYQSQSLARLLACSLARKDTRTTNTQPTTRPPRLFNMRIRIFRVILRLFSPTTSFKSSERDQTNNRPSRTSRQTTQLAIPRA